MLLSRGEDLANFVEELRHESDRGLTPRRFQSGEKDNLGRTSHAGDADVRATLHASANAMLTPV